MRELRNVVERAVLVCEVGSAIGVLHLPQEKMGRVLPARDSQGWRARASSVSGAATVLPLAAPGRMEDGRARVIAALERCRGNQTNAAKMLGVSRRTLITKMERYALPRPRKNRAASDTERPGLEPTADRSDPSEAGGADGD